MNILVFSDTHLYLPFDEKKYFFLEKIISQSDRVIINGDFFDGYMCRFDDFIKSEWSRLFPLLKEKKAVYLFGNHDKKEFSNQKTNLFSAIQADRYKIKINEKSFIFEHGHKIRVTADIFIKFSWDFLHRAVSFGHFFRNFMTRLFGWFFIRMRFKYRNGISKKKIMKRYSPQENEIYIIGHNHFGEVDPKYHFAASGATLYGYSQYLTINNGKVILHEQKY